MSQKWRFAHRLGIFSLKVLNFGLTNALATYQSAMNNVFEDVMGKLVLVYLDDILIFLKNLAGASDACLGTSLKRSANNASVRKHQSVRFALVSLSTLATWWAVTESR